MLCIKSFCSSVLRRYSILPSPPPPLDIPSINFTSQHGPTTLFGSLVHSKLYWPPSNTIFMTTIFKKIYYFCVYIMYYKFWSSLFVYSIFNINQNLKVLSHIPYTPTFSIIEYHVTCSMEVALINSSQQSHQINMLNNL